MHGKLTLKLADKAKIKQGEGLNDKHIRMAQYLAKMQFPVTAGLELHFCKEKRQLHTQYCANIFFCKERCHWITASTKFSVFGKVDIYDTMLIS